MADKDLRVPCKYGSKCFRKNPAHHEHYKHPPKSKLRDEDTLFVAKKHKVDDVNIECKDISESDADYESTSSEHNDSTGADQYQAGVRNDISESNDEDEDSSSERIKKKRKLNHSNIRIKKKKISNDVSLSDDDDSMEVISNNQADSPKKPVLLNKESPKNECQKNIPKIEQANTPTKSLDDIAFHKELIKNKFLFKMPKDFYTFWEVCKTLNNTNPCEAFSSVGLKLVGPYDILAGHFHRDDRQSSEYLLHWRYFHDPPELQTVLKGSDKTGYHLGYFRDTPTDMPVFMVENHASRDGILSVIGDNIFAAVSIYLEDQKASADPFSKMKINKFLSVLKNKAETLNFDLAKKTKRILDRYKRTVCKTFNKIGLVVPYEKKSQLGYRPLTLSDKELEQLFSKIQNAAAADKRKLLAELQPTLTFANIASDEGDFGTGIELGWNIIAHGIEDLNVTASIYLASNYELLNRPEFAKIAVAHMASRKKGCNLSIL